MTHGWSHWRQYLRGLKFQCRFRKVQEDFFFTKKLDIKVGIHLWVKALWRWVKPLWRQPKNNPSGISCRIAEITARIDYRVTTGSSLKGNSSKHYRISTTAGNMTTLGARNCRIHIIKYTHVMAEIQQNFFQSRFFFFFYNNNLGQCET